ALAPYGLWVTIEPYGDCWVPDVSYDWRPYTDGYWARSDWGWMFVSDEPWGWATYHYGRWTFDDDYGWVWVPGRVWAPAWVAWRCGDGVLGWAPLPPQANWRIGVGFSVGNFDFDAYVGPSWWSFVRYQDFCRPRVIRYVLPYRDCDRYYHVTQNTTR